jgi:uncharacterized membrane protein YccC
MPMIGERAPEGRQTEARQPAYRRDHADRVVGTVASVLGMLVVLASIPSPSRTGLMATAGVLLGVFGCLLGTRLLGATTAVVSLAVILTWLLS